MSHFISIIQELSRPTENGIVIFVSGFLFIMGIFHFLLYFQHKDKSYLFYSIYALTVFIYTYHRAPNFILTQYSDNLIPTLKFLYDPIKWFYSSIYLYFAIYFIDLKKYNPRWFKRIDLFNKISLSVMFILVIISTILNDASILKYAYNFAFMPVIFVLSIFILYIFYQTESLVKYYIIIGGGVYLLVTSFSHFLTYSGHPFRVLFYGAVTFEIILFALGLGQKQKNILEEKNKWQTLIIKQHEENLQYKDMLASKLDKQVEEKTSQILSLIKENEAEKRKKMALKYSKQLLKLRMHALQSQMNPHFLFNSLNSIKHFIINNRQKDAIAYLTKFAKLIRIVLDYSKLGEISLAEELDMMKLYLEIENYRFENKLDYNFDIDDTINLHSIKVPPIILQAFIENSIWHGLAPKKDDMKIDIVVKKQFPYIIIDITDNGIGREKASIIKSNKSDIINKESMGIKISIERLQTFTASYKNKAGIDIIDLYDSNNQATGTTIRLKIPLE